ncbi:MAG TPA: CcdB family protein [Burkholderiales bacterium]|nr:CcdB family protein [Burkholderiales bacterium]
MSRFDVYRNEDGPGFLLDVQTNLLDNLNTRVVVPLLPIDRAPIPAKILNPVFEIDGISVSMVTQFMAAVPAKILKRALTSLDRKQNEITAALDFLFHGF